MYHLICIREGKNNLKNFKNFCAHAYLEIAQQCNATLKTIAFNSVFRNVIM